uniref:ABC transporter C family member 13 isoform X3 n=1 Tax=Rhizophora mucronata TaxID=61149 RepID=A0A2P2M4M1_RHIMU
MDILSLEPSNVGSLVYLSHLFFHTQKFLFNLAHILLTIFKGKQR